MKFEIDGIIKDMLSHPRVAKRVEELGLNREQVIEALPIMIDMVDQKDDEHTKYLTSFYISETGSIKRMEIRSKWWEKYAYLENVITQHITEVDFEDDKDFLKEPARKALIAHMAHYFNSKKYQKGIYLYGPIGIGKTFIMKKIARKLAMQGHKIGFILLSEMALRIKASFNDVESSYEDTINDLKNVPYLFIDDIGAEQIGSWFRDDILFTVLNERMQKSRTTFFTSNFSYKQLASIQSKTSNSKYRDTEKAERLLSRVEALSIPYELKGQNKR